jgi:hypothetical protein
VGFNQLLDRTRASFETLFVRDALDVTRVKPRR